MKTAQPDGKTSCKETSCECVRNNARAQKCEQFCSWSQEKEAIKDCEKDKAFLQNVNEDEQIDACNRMIKGCQDQIDWVLYVNNQFIDITCTFKDKEGSVERCLSAFVGVMKRFADRLDALLLTYGIDLLKLQRESGLYLKRYRIVTDVDVYIGSTELAQMYIDALPKEPQPEQTKDGMVKLPDELNTPSAEEYFNKALSLGWMEKTEAGFKWKKSKAELAYFCEKIYCPNQQGRFPETALNKLFNVTRLQSALSKVYDAIKEQSWKHTIDNIFK